jgi:hypothetical protein
MTKHFLSASAVLCACAVLFLMQARGALGDVAHFSTAAAAPDYSAADNEDAAPLGGEPEAVPPGGDWILSLPQDEESSADALQPVSLAPVLAYRLGRDWHVGAGLHYAPLVSGGSISDTRGSASQFIASIGFSYSFGVQKGRR